MPGHGHSARHGGGATVWQDGALASATGVIGESDFGWDEDPRIADLRSQLETAKQQRDAMPRGEQRRYYEEQVKMLEGQVKQAKEEDERRRRHGGPHEHRPSPPTGYIGQPPFASAPFSPYGQQPNGLPGNWQTPRSLIPRGSEASQLLHHGPHFMGEGTGELASDKFGELGGVKGKKFG